MVAVIASCATGTWWLPRHEIVGECLLGFRGVGPVAAVSRSVVTFRNGEYLVSDAMEFPVVRAEFGVTFFGSYRLFRDLSKP